MSVVSSIGFDRDDEFFAMGGVTKYVVTHRPARSKKNRSLSRRRSSHA